MNMDVFPFIGKVHAQMLELLAKEEERQANEAAKSAEKQDAAA